MAFSQSVVAIRGSCITFHNVQPYSYQVKEQVACLIRKSTMQISAEEEDKDRILASYAVKMLIFTRIRIMCKE